jgi:hypothetical protein
VSPFWPIRAAVASAARPKPCNDSEPSNVTSAWAGAAYGGKEGVSRQLGEIGAETESVALAGLEGCMLCELLRWGRWFGGVHGQGNDALPKTFCSLHAPALGSNEHVTRTEQLPDVSKIKI